VATLTPGKAVTVSHPVLLVETELAAGRYRFQLVVIDDGGLESDPAELVVTVRPSRPFRPRDPFTRPVIFEPVVERRINPDIIGRIRRPP
jgi:hypothetical protein